MDFSAILAAVDVTSLVAGIGSIAAVLATVRVTKYGFKSLLSFIPGGR
jgi:hypothetical protein